MADKIFGAGLDPVPLKYVTGSYPELEGPAVPVTIFDLPSAGAPDVTPGAAVADLAGDADLPTTVAKVNELLASLRAAGFISA